MTDPRRPPRYPEASLGVGWLCAAGLELEQERRGSLDVSLEHGDGSLCLAGERQAVG